MKKKPASLAFRIPKPCGQSYEEMHPLPGGRYCDRCEKTVVDFSGMSDGEMIRLYRQRQGRVCGVFRPDQLEREMVLPGNPKKSNWRSIAVFVSALLLGHTVKGQDASRRTDPSGRTGTALTKEELFMRGLNPVGLPAKMLIEGMVVDDQGEPMIGANVVLSTGNGTVTGENGRFSLVVPLETDSMILTVTYVGYKEQKVKWFGHAGSENQLTVRMEAETQILDVAVVTGLKVQRSTCILTGMVVQTRSDEDLLTERDPVDTDESNDPLLEVFPNPFLTTFSVKMEVTAADAYLFHLYTEAGQLVFAETRELKEDTHILPFDLGRHELPAGAYFLRISDRKGEIRTKKLVRVR